jgi:hypothetical protein
MQCPAELVLDADIVQKQARPGRGIVRAESSEGKEAEAVIDTRDDR